MDNWVASVKSKQEVWSQKIRAAKDPQIVDMTDATAEELTAVIRSVLRDFRNPILMSKTKQLRQIARDNPEAKQHSPAEITGRVLEALQGAKQTKRSFLGTLLCHLYEVTLLETENKMPARSLAVCVTPMLFEPAMKSLQETISEAQRRTAEEHRIVELMINVASDLCPQLLTPEPEPAKHEFAWLKKKLANLAALKR